MHGQIQHRLGVQRAGQRAQRQRRKNGHFGGRRCGAQQRHIGHTDHIDGRITDRPLASEFDTPPRNVAERSVVVVRVVGMIEVLSAETCERL